MQRYFIEQSNWSNDSVIVTGEDVHHITRVMRKEIGDELIGIHPDQRIALCEITEFSQDQVVCQINHWLDENRELPVRITVVQSLGKGDKLEQVVQKGTELGAYDFIPYQAARSIVKWDQKKASKKVDRLQKIAKEAAEQSQRSHVPEVSSVKSTTEILQLGEDFDLKLFAYENEAKQKEFQSLGTLMRQAKRGTRVLVVFGPEGGFSESEVERLRNHSFYSVRLGPRILRMETAPLYFLSSVSYQLEELME